MTTNQVHSTKSISVRLPSSLLYKAKHFSDDSDLTLSQTIRRALLSYGDIANQPDNPPPVPQKWAVGAR